MLVKLISLIKQVICCKVHFNFARLCPVNLYGTGCAHIKIFYLKAVIPLLQQHFSPTLKNTVPVIIAHN
jgi:hypothetical protein